MAIPPGLHDSFTEEGLWWKEGKENDRVGGTLTFDPEGGSKLKLLGTLTQASVFAIFSGTGEEDTNIHGFTKNGKPVTLLRSMVVNRQLNMPGIANEEWRSDFLVIGAHITSDEEDIFSKSYIRFHGIEKWLGHNAFKIVHDEAESSLIVRAGKPRETHFASHSEFEITSVGSLYGSNNPDTRYTIDAISQLGITPSSPKSLRWHFQKAVRLQELAALCTGHYLPLTSLELRELPQDLGGGENRPSEVHVYARLLHSEIESRPKNEAPILSGPELMASSPEAVQKWFDQYDVFSPAIGLFFTITGQRFMFGNVRFLLAAQALEVFHRRTSSESVISSEEFPAFVESLIKAIPASATSRMKAKLEGTYRFINEPSLAQRLKSIINFLSSEFDFTPPAFSEAYIRKIVDTRNYYTHFSKELSNKRFDENELHWAVRRIVLLLSILFLLRLGLSANALAPLLRRHREFSKLWTTKGHPFQP